MHLVPVIDLLNGLVVHAKQGLRQSYLPVQSCLTSSADPVEMVKALLDLHLFKTIYIADLNAIQNQGNNWDIITFLRQSFPDCEFWLDAGKFFSTSINNLTGIIGSESFENFEELSRILNNQENQILSLDFQNNSLLGPANILQNTQLWPHRIIIMNLQSVGSNAGPDINHFQSVSRLSENHKYYAAGGIRNLEDLVVLRETGASGALIATALHNGVLGKVELELMGG